MRIYSPRIPISYTRFLPREAVRAPRSPPWAPRYLQQTGDTGEEVVVCVDTCCVYYVVVESRAAGSRGARAAARADPSGRRRGTEGGAPRQGILPPRRDQRGSTTRGVEGVEGGVPEREGDRAACEWNMDRGGVRILNANRVSISRFNSVRSRGDETARSTLSPLGSLSAQAQRRAPRSWMDRVG